MGNLFRVAKAYRNDEREDQRDAEINVAIRTRPPGRDSLAAARYGMLAVGSTARE
jgi:hypothetical protein